MHQRVSSPRSQGKSWLLHNVMKISTELYCHSNISLVTLQGSWSVKRKICEARKDHYIKGKGSWVQSHLMLNICWGCIIPFTWYYMKEHKGPKLCWSVPAISLYQRYCTRSFKCLAGTKATQSHELLRTMEKGRMQSRGKEACLHWYTSGICRTDQNTWGKS